jgi:hypothetical protein
VSRPASHYRIAVTNKQGPLVSSIFPQILPCSTPRVLIGKILSSSRPPVECSHHVNIHFSTCRCESLRRLRCAMASHRHCPLLCCRPSLLQLGCPRRELDDEVSSRLPRAALFHPLAAGRRLWVIPSPHLCCTMRWHARVCRMATSIHPLVYLTSSPTAYGQTPSTSPPRKATATATSLLCLPACMSTLALLPHRAVTPLSLSLHRPALPPRNARL